MFRRVDASDLGRYAPHKLRPRYLAVPALFLVPLVLGCYGLLSGQPLLASGGFILHLLIGDVSFVLAVIVFLSPRSGARWVFRLYLRGRWPALITLQLLTLVCAFFLALILHIIVSYLVTEAS